MNSPFKIRKIRGTDNVSDPVNLQPRGGTIYLREILNIDIDDEGKPHRRKGSHSNAIVSGRIHSLWSNVRIILFVQDGVLMKLKRDLSGAVQLVTGVDPNDPMAYVGVGDNIVFFSNSSIVGHVIGELAYPFPNPQQQFKQRMIGGQLLEFYNGRLYVANKRNLFYSDATILTRMDTRKNVIAFPGRITMLKAVGNGLYVSSENETKGETVFLAGAAPGDFINRSVLDEAALEGSAVSLEGDELGRGGMGKTVYFATPSGLYKGYPDGLISQRQDGVFSIEDEAKKVTATIREVDGYQQYIMVYQLKPEIGGIAGEYVAPVPKQIT